VHGFNSKDLAAFLLVSLPLRLRKKKKQEKTTNDKQTNKQTKTQVTPTT